MPQSPMRLSVTSFLVAGCLLAACSTPAPTAVSPAAPAPAAKGPAASTPKGGEYKAAITADAPSLHPYKSTDTTSSEYQGRMLVGALWRWNPQTITPEPFVAESWKVSDDKKVYTFKLRDLKWSDGKPVTAHDYAWTHEQAMKPDNKWPYRADPAENVTSYKALDDKTLEIALKEPKPEYVALGIINAAVSYPLPKHIWEKLDWNDPTKNSEINKPSVVNGQYKLVEQQRDNFTTFERNDGGYFRGDPNLDKVTYKIVPNQQVGLQQLLGGEVDAASISANDYEKAKSAANLNEFRWEPVAASWSYIGFNLRRAPMNDVQFRRAVAYATPRDQISDKVYNKLAKPTYSTYPPTSPFYNPNVAKYDYSMDTAKKMLDDAGYKLNADGKRLGKDGKPLKLKFMHNTPNAQREKIAVIMQEQLKQLGIEVEIVALEWGAFLNATKTAPFDWDLNVLGWSVPIEPSRIKGIWSKKTIPELNSVAYESDVVEKLYEDGEREFDPEKRKAIYQEIQKVLADDVPYVFLVYSLGWDFQNKRVNPNNTSRLGIGYDFQQWFVQDQK